MPKTDSNRKRFIKYLGWYAVELSQTVFNVSVVTFIAYFALENFKTGLISNYFDLNLLLSIAVVCGLVSLLFEENGFSGKVRKRHYLFLISFAIILALFAFQNLQFLGKTGLIASLTALIAVLTILSLFTKNYD